MLDINNILKNANLTGGFPTWTSNYCYEHIPPYKIPAEPTRAEMVALQEKFRVQMMLQDDVEVCPRCVCDRETKALEDEISAQYQDRQQKEKRDTFHKLSIFQDETLKFAKFDNYELEEDEHEARVNKQHVLQAVEDYKKGQTFNMWLVGNVGVGKSHLSVSTLKELRDLNTSCLFIDLYEMFRLIRSSMFEDEDSKYTESYFIDLCSTVDFLVLDDLGAEIGNIKTDKTASDFTTRILRAIVNSRQDKSTIVTTNLPQATLKKIYDPKVIDRLQRNIRLIKYSETKSFRSRGAEF